MTASVPANAAAPGVRDCRCGYRQFPGSGSRRRDPGQPGHRSDLRLHVGDAAAALTTSVPCSVASGKTRLALVRIVSSVMRRPAAASTGAGGRRWRRAPSLSWQIAMIAVPRAFASLIMATTAARFSRIERRGRFVQQQHRMAADEAAREVHPLLLAAGKGRRRQSMQPAWDVQSQQQRGGAAASLVLRRAAADQHLSDHVERRHARHHAEKLAHIAEGVVTDRDDGARVGGRRDRPSRRDGGS